MTFDKKTVEWLDTTLSKITKENPNEYVFVFTHSMISDTCYGSNYKGAVYGGSDSYWYTDDLTDVMNKYPQAVTFSGHLHFPINDERSIMQTNFTAIGCGSVSYMAIENEYNNVSGAKTTDSAQISAGHLVQVDKNGNVKITRLDFTDRTTFKTPWIIETPNSENTHLNKYTAARGTDGNSAPVMDGKAQVNTSKVGSLLSASLTFETGKDDDLIHHYKITVKDADSDRTVKRFTYLSDFYKYATPDKMSKEMTISLGALKTERGNRVFPVSDRASDIIDALFLWVRRTGVSIVHASVSDLVMQDGRVTGVRAGKKTCLADRVIVATGGASYPQTGSTGDGYRFAREAGHTVVPANPSLVPLVESGETCRSLMGLSLRNVQLTVFENEKKIYTDFGEMLFTHFGLSGPLVLSASAHMRHFGSKSYRVEIDLKPALDEKTLDRRLLADFDKHKNSDFINALGELLPRKLIPAVIEKSGIDPREKVNTITKKQRASLLRVLKAFPVEISGKRPIAEAIVTTGGVSVREVSPKTMESKKCSGLYFAGEVLDVDAYTGGFNLQIAWSTGRLAGLSAAQEEE